MRINKEMLKGNTEIFVLSLLNEKDMYGYEIAKELRERTHNRMDVKEGTIYVVLKRLEKSDYIYSYWKDEESSEGARRKYFSIRETGRIALEEKCQEWELINGIMNSFLGGRK